MIDVIMTWRMMHWRSKVATRDVGMTNVRTYRFDHVQRAHLRSYCRNCLELHANKEPRNGSEGAKGRVRVL